MLFEDAHELLLDCFPEGYIGEDEFLALYELSTSQNHVIHIKITGVFNWKRKMKLNVYLNFVLKKMIFLFLQRHSEYQKSLNVIKGRYMTELRGFAFY